MNNAARPIRILYQSLSESGAASAYEDGLRAHIARISAADAVVDFRQMPPDVYRGASPIEVQRLPHLFQTIFAPLLLDAVADAEATGYDAVIMGCYSEPWLRELRSRVTIPVISVFETALLVGFTAAQFVGLVTTTPEICFMHRSLVAQAGFTARVSGYYALEPALTEKQLARALDEPTAVVDAFESAARRAIADFADAVVPAEGILNELLAGLGITELDGVPIVDGIGAAVLMAIMQANLQRRTGLHVGRRWQYPTDLVALGDDPIETAST